MKSDYLRELTDSIGFPDAVPREELRRLFRMKKTVRLAKGEFFLRAGAVPDRLGYVVSGLLRLFYLDETGKEVNKHFCPERTVAASYGAFLGKTESGIAVQALEDSRLFVIDRAAYAELLESHACWQTVARKLAELIFMLGQKREAELLLLDAGERYAGFVRDYPDLVNRISQYHIASYLGIAPESLSRIRAQRSRT